LEKAMNKMGQAPTFQEATSLRAAPTADAPFFVLLTGRVEFVDRKPGKDVHVAAAIGGNLHRATSPPSPRATISARSPPRRPRRWSSSARRCREMVAAGRVRRTDLPHSAGAAGLHEKRVRGCCG